MIEHLLQLKTQSLPAYIKAFLKFYKVEFKHDKRHNYIVTNVAPPGSPLICVHIDTKNAVTDSVTTKRKNGIVSLASDHQCLGADDRAGVYIAMKLINYFAGSEFPYDFAFFDKEETGGIGSDAFAQDTETEYQCFIGLDRASRGGKQNIATYGYDNDVLLAIAHEHFKYEIQSGTFTDCSNLSGYFPDTPCFNLSIGYEHEHSPKETLNLALMYQTLELLKSFQLSPDVKFKVKYKIPQFNRGWIQWDDDVDLMEPLLCDRCLRHEPLYAVESYKGVAHLCEDCVDMIEQESTITRYL
jgi:putative aminopeptidase FrvX